MDVVSSLLEWVTDLFSLPVDGFSPSGPRPDQKVEVPDFGGQAITDARYNAMRAGVKLNTVVAELNPLPTRGMVMAQDPAPGSVVRRDSEVTVWLHFPPELRS